MAHAIAGLTSSHNSIDAAVEDGGSYSNTRRPWSVICDKVFECTEHSADLNTSLAMSGLRPHTTRQSTHLLQEFSWEVVNHHPPYSLDLAPSDFHLFLHLRNFCPISVNVFKMIERRWVSRWFQSKRKISTTQDTKVDPTLWQMSQFRRCICWKTAQYSPYTVCSNKSFH